MKKSSFVLSAIILAFGGFFAKAIGALYKIPLTNILGTSGMGIYYLIFPIYSLIITISSNGLSVALSTEVAKCRKVHNYYNEQKLFRTALIIGFFISLIFALIIIFLSSTIAEIQGNINGNLGYIAIAPAIIISTMIAIIRGYFQGIENMVPTTISMIIEQIIKLSIGLILAHKFCIYGIQYAVLGAVLGVTASEVVAMIIIVFNFVTYKGQLHYNYINKRFRKRIKKKHIGFLKSKTKLLKTHINIKRKLYKCSSTSVRYSTIDTIKRISKISIPATFTSILIPISTMLDSFMIINLLTLSGYSSLISTSLYGLWGGVVQSLISLPTIIVTAISTSLVPSLSGVLVQSQPKEIENRIQFFIKISWILSIILFIIMYVFAEDILIFLYGDGLSKSVIDELYYATKMLQLSSISIIYYSFLQTFTAILQTLGKSIKPFFALLIGLVFRIISIYLLVGNPSINIFGGIIANILFLSIATILLALEIKKYVNLEYSFYKHLFKPLIIGIVLMLLAVLCHKALKYFINYFASMMIVGVLMVTIYIIWIFFGKVFTSKEKTFFKFSKKKISKNG